MDEFESMRPMNGVYSFTVSYLRRSLTFEGMTESSKNVGIRYPKQTTQLTQFKVFLTQLNTIGSLSSPEIS